MRLVLISTFVCIQFLSFRAMAQFGACDCSASAGAGPVNFSTLTWTGTGCPTAGSTSYTGNLCLDLANTTNLNFDQANFTVNGNFKISNNGSSTFTLPSPNTLHVTGNMGDNANNNVTFTINGALDVDGTLYGKNSNGFSGTGSVSAGGLNFNQEPTGGTTINWDVPPGQCVPASTFCTMAMPIKLLYFTAELNEDAVLLNWATEKEESFDHFEIERASSNLKFITITEVPGAGYNTETLQKYSWVDSNPFAGQNYYRLKAVDLDGSFEYFKIVTASASGNKKFVVYPNPTKDKFVNYLVNFDNSGDDKIIVMDNIGNVLQQTSISINGKLVFDDAINPGLYFVQYVAPDFRQIVRVTIR